MAVPGVMRRILPEMDLSTIAGVALIVYAATGYWLGRFDLAGAGPWLSAGIALMGLPQRRAVPTVETATGEVVPVSPEPPNEPVGVVRE